MKLPILVLNLFTLTHLQVGHARTLSSRSEVLASSNNSSTVAMNCNVTELQNTTTVTELNSQRYNETALATKPNAISQSTVVTHILRTKRETEATLPYDFNTLHLPCDLDNVRQRSEVLYNYPNHCIWVWNNRYAHEGFFRIFKTYQLEAFFFAQWYERLKRYEMDPHIWA